MVFCILLEVARTRIFDYKKRFIKIIIDESGIWIQAGIYSGEKRLTGRGIGLIDVAILRVARKTNSTIWTLDKKLQNILRPDERYTEALK